MNKDRVAVVVRCFSAGEAISAIKSFPALDDVDGVLVLLTEVEFDDELTEYANRFGCKIINTSPIADGFDLGKQLKMIDEKLEWVAFWPRRGKFSRAAGLSSAISHLIDNGGDYISGLVRYGDDWISEAGNFHEISSEMSLLALPSELENYSWRPAGAHGITQMDYGGSLLLIKIKSLPKSIPLMAENISWGLLLTLAGSNLQSLKCLVYTGLQATSTLKKSERKPPSRQDTQLLHGLLSNHSLEEIVIFGQGKLVRDDDYQQVHFQEMGLLNAEGKDKGEIELSSYYQAPNSSAVIGPLYTLEKETTNPDMIPKGQLHQLQKDFAKVNNEKAVYQQKLENNNSRLVENIRTIDLCILLAKRLVRKFFKKAIR